MSKIFASCWFAESKTALAHSNHVPQHKPAAIDIFFLHRYPPFFDDNPFGIYQKILAGKLEFPRHLDFYVK